MLGNVHAGRVDAVFELHRVVHFVDLQTFFGFERSTATTPPPTAAAAASEISATSAVIGQPDAGRAPCWDPVLGFPVDGCNTFIADDEASNIAPALFGYVLLDVENPVVIRTEHGLVFENGLSGVAVIDFRQQATPNRQPVSRPPDNRVLPSRRWQSFP